jgi:hypothetical protein
MPKSAMVAKRRTKRSTTSSDLTDDSEIIEVPGWGTLTGRQKRFADAYFVHGNGTRAAREAGYSGDDDDLGAAASRYLRNPKIQWYLARLGANAGLTRGDVTGMLMREGVSADHAGARVRALELLGKSVGMFVDETLLTSVARVRDADLVAIIAGDDPALRDVLMRKLTGED